MFKSVDPHPDFPLLEKKLLERWYKKGIIKKYLLKNQKALKRFSFIDGPITANNPMGVHHAWGRTYKDLWQRFFNLLGYQQRFQNGFDCQGLWVEVEVEKELGLKSKKDIENLVRGDKKASIARFVEFCKKRVLKYAQIQTEQSKRLGYFMDWDHSYFTMSDENNYMIWYFLKKCFENGWIYKGRDAVAWCPRCETAISQHEMLTEDYKEVIHEAVYFKLPIIHNSKFHNSYFIVWTTTPWTIPGNVALAVNPELTYVKLKIKDEYLILAKSRVDKIFNKDEYEIKEKFDGKALIGLSYQSPFDDFPRIKEAKKTNLKTFHIVVDGKDLVTEEEGTGILHVAPGAGQEDFTLGRKENLSLIELIDERASYLDRMDEFSFKNAKKHPELIIDFLKKHEEGEFFLKTERYKHRYPACWRCKTELVWRVTDEWYIAMDKPSKSKVKSQKSKVENKTLRDRMVEVAKKINWIPEFGLARELDWLKNMDDWLISKKNRYWGLALPIYECEKCGHFQVIGGKEELRERAIAGWEQFEGRSPHKPWIDEVVIECSKCKGKVKRIDDVGNPWLDAGIVPFSTITKDNKGESLYNKDRKEWQKWFPADFITESFPGQFKNWFYSLIAMATVLEDSNSFKRVLGFGTLLGEDGRPMHKSWGNAIEFNEGADKIGVDVMRWMYARHNPEENLLFGYKKADEVRRQFYLMLWNIYKFFVEYANLDKWFPSVIPTRQLAGRNLSKRDSSVASFPQNNNLKQNILDLWILSRFHWLVGYIEKNLLAYNAKDAALEIEKFVSNLSTWYIRRSRERIWVNSESKEDKESFYFTLHYILVNLSIILSPFLPFVSEEIYTNLMDEESVHLASWPKVESKINFRTIEDMNFVRQIVEFGHAVRKFERIRVRQPLSNVSITIKASSQELSKEYERLIEEELNVKGVVWEVDKKVLQDVSRKASKFIPKGYRLGNFLIEFDKNITNELKVEGEVRDLIRKIQEERKKLNLRQDQLITLILPEYPKEHTDLIKRKVMAKEIRRGDRLAISL